jgi:hypothetical protein
MTLGGKSKEATMAYFKVYYIYIGRLSTIIGNLNTDIMTKTLTVYHLNTSDVLHCLFGSFAYMQFL